MWRSIEGLPPAISIDQKSTNRNPRSTVGTVTEIYDYFRLLYAQYRYSSLPEVWHGRSASRPLTRWWISIMALPERTKIQLIGTGGARTKGNAMKSSLEQGEKEWLCACDRWMAIYMICLKRSCWKRISSTISRSLSTVWLSKPGIEKRLTDSIEDSHAPDRGTGRWWMSAIGENLHDVQPELFLPGLWYQCR